MPSRSVIASTSGTISNGTMIVDYTIGEPITETIGSGKNLFTQGFNQPNIDHNKLPIYVGSKFPNFKFPNAFTPNSDGFNDLFVIDIPDSLKAGTSVMIFDEWGKNIFYTNNAAEYWNGRFYNTGDLVPTDVYVYVVKFSNPYKKEYTGTVTVHY